MVASGIATWLSWTDAEVSRHVYGNVAVGRIDVQLVTGPARLVAFGIALGTDIACRRKISQHLRQRLAGLALEPAGLFDHDHLALPRPAALAFGRGRPSDLHRLLACLDRGRVARDVADEMILERSFNQGLMHALGNALVGKLGKSARERRLARHIGRALPANKTTQRRVDMKTLNQRRRGRQVEHRLGDKRARQRMAIIERTAGPAIAHPNNGLHANHLQHGDEPLVIIRERSDLRLQPGRKMTLNVAPAR